MRRRHHPGFTIVELTVVIVIIGILMSLAIVNVLNTRITGRDSERQTDIETLARHFESLYNNSSQSGQTFASYPGINQAVAATSPIRDNINASVFFSPSAPVTSTYTNMSIRGATNTAQTPTAIAPQPSAGDTYVYQPFKRDNTLCQDTSPNPNECVRFNLFYWHEASNQIRKITSQNQ